MNLINPNDLPYLATVHEAANFARINVTAMYNLVHRKDFKAAVRIGKRILILRDEFIKFLIEQAQKNS